MQPSKNINLTSETNLSMLHIILYQPEIPPNTGNIIRLCANSGTHLHLIGPLGFQLDHSKVKRAGLDYAELALVKQYLNWQAFKAEHPGMRLWAFSTRGSTRYDQAGFSEGDGLLFGPETRGLPEDVLDEIGTPQCLYLPMAQKSRSLNLSNSAAIGLYEAWRQLEFNGCLEKN
jgi:tRNA (cytidine/uridine-2'-O-)-methyltransferase